MGKKRQMTLNRRIVGLELHKNFSLPTNCWLLVPLGQHDQCKPHMSFPSPLSGNRNLLRVSGTASNWWQPIPKLPSVIGTVAEPFPNWWAQITPSPSAYPLTPPLGRKCRPKKRNLRSYKFMTLHFAGWKKKLGCWNNQLGILLCAVVQK